MKIFLTGSTGFIGKALAEHLGDEGHTLHLLVRSSSKAASLNIPGVQIFEGDITDAHSVRRAMQGCTHVFHLAAYAKPVAKDSHVFHEVNVEGTRNVLEAAQKEGVTRVVFTSSAGTFGATGPDHDASEQSQRPRKLYTDYAITKKQAEDLCNEYRSKGLDIVIVYPSRVYGPGLLSESNAVTKILRMYKRGRWRIIPGNGKTIGNYVFVEDVARGHLLAMNKGRKGEDYILGGENASFIDFFNAMKHASGKNRLLARIPYPLLWLAAAFMMGFGLLIRRPAIITPGWVKRYLQHRRLSSRKAIDELGYRITPLSEGFAKTLEWTHKRNKQPVKEGDHYYALITGASSGIGRSFAIEWAKRGKNLLLVSLPGTGLPELATEIGNTYGVDCHILELDLMETDAHKKVYDYARQNNLQVNVLINNAGIGFNDRFDQMPGHKISNMLMLNVMVTTSLTHIFLPDFHKLEKAYILNLASMGSFSPLPGKCVYSASKAYIMYFTKGLRGELKGSNIQVSAIFPAGVPTNSHVKKRIANGGIFAKGLAVSAETVAHKGVEGLLRGKEMIFPGKRIKAFFFTSSLIPQGVVLYLTGREFKRVPDKG
jgi:NAD+-dependent farnesol dehydrogenase